MTNENSFHGLLHRAMHRIPGVPRHAERPAGHQGTTHHSRTRQRSQNRKGNHSTARPPRVLVAWQRRIAAFFGQELS
jgi:hypothetical protein